MRFPHFLDFNWSHTLPQLYWDVYSEEQRIKALCMTYQKLVEFVDAMVDTVNAQYAAIEEMREELPALVVQSLKEDDELKAEVMQIIEDWFNETMTGTAYQELKDNGFIFKEGE